MKGLDRTAGEEHFDVDSFTGLLATSWLTWRIRYLSFVDSTNRLALDLARQGEPEGTAVLADAQGSGRGRLGRSWYSPPGRNVYLSVILRPKIEEARAPLLAMVAGVAAAEAIGELCPGDVKLKWPNDVLISGKKVCGILAQAAGGTSLAVVVGIGLNVNMDRGDLPGELKDSATSLMLAAERRLCREEAAALVCAKLAGWYRTFLEEGFGPVKREWLSRTVLVGETVRVLFGEEKIEGIARGIDEDGALILEGKGGMRRVLAGDATFLKGVT